jgi:hypothetical protein
MKFRIVEKKNGFATWYQLEYLVEGLWWKLLDKCRERKA